MLFDHDDEAKVFLERTLGLEKANPMLRDAGSRSGAGRSGGCRPLDEELEYRARRSGGRRSSPFRRLLPEKAAAPDPGDAAARRLAEEALRTTRGLDPSALRFIEATVERRPARVDRTFVWESTDDPVRGCRAPLPRRGAGRPRRALVALLEVPERVARGLPDAPLEERGGGHGRHVRPLPDGGRARRRFSERVRRQGRQVELGARVRRAGAVLQLAASLNELPIALFDYETAESWASFLAQAVLGGRRRRAACSASSLFLLVAAGEPLYREAYPGQAGAGPALLACAARVEAVLPGAPPGLRADGVLLRLPGRLLPRSPTASAPGPPPTSRTRTSSGPRFPGSGSC